MEEQYLTIKNLEIEDSLGNYGTQNAMVLY